MAKRKDMELTIRSSAAEYLTYVAATGDTPESYEMRYEDENIWLTQRMMAELYGVDVRTVNEHLQKIYADGELQEGATIRKFRIVQTEGGRQVSREVKHYNLQAIIAVGFKVNNERAVQFRKWAAQVVKDYTIQGWVMDKERLIRGHLFTDEYFERQLQNIREIRMSERKFYQKVTDLYATAFDYDKDAATTRRFFQTVQNKLHFAVHRHTAAELILERADAGKEHMGLTSWESAPGGKIVKADVSVAKNYLSETELSYLERIVSLYLDYAELQAQRRIPMSMADWAARLDGFLEFNGNEILTGPGKISAEQAKLYAESEYEKYRVIQDRLFESDFDRFLQLE
ncbi:MAG: virulence RhuM family protein, partial [Oscillospiraceae bacterium]|nr:virulence RhuM family protein [Oscillospiraceae bacterium]